MKMGDIFRKTFSLSNQKLTLSEIEKHTPKKPKYQSYGLSIVSKRGNVFSNRDLDIDQMVDRALQTPLSTLR